MSATLGWDIGGVNTKVARVAGGRVLAVHARPFELQRDPGALSEVLRQLAAETGAQENDEHAVTMTAELSQMFRFKRDGVLEMSQRTIYLMQGVDRSGQNDFRMRH